MGSSGGGGETFSTPTQIGQYRTLLGEADELLRGPGFYDPEFAGGQPTLAAPTGEQTALWDRLTAEGGAVESGLGLLERNLGQEYDPNNPQLQGIIDATLGDLQRTFDRGRAIDIDQEATGAGVGQFSGSRAGIAEGLALSDLQQQGMDLSSRLRFDDYQTYRQQQQRSLENLGSLTEGLNRASGYQQEAEQARLDDLFARWEYESGVPLQNLLAYKGLVSGDMGGTGKTAESGGK